METKPGIKTTELWVTILASLYSVLLTLGVIPHSDEVMAMISSIGSMLVAFGYSWGRVFIKTNK